MQKSDTIYIAGHLGMVGSAIKKELEREGYCNLLYKSRTELNLENEFETGRFISENKPDYVIIAAAKVGGILANKNNKVEFFLKNINIQNNLIKHSFENGVKKICFLGSSCIYPKGVANPIKEEYLLSGKLEETNEAYAIAKIAGIRLLDYYREEYGKSSISIMPCNLYGYNDNFDLESSHVLPALIRKFVEAKESGAKDVVVWGSGEPLREFMFVDDLARAVLFLMKADLDIPLINVGSDSEISIKKLAEIIKKKVGFAGEVIFDKSKPDGIFRKLMDSSKIKELGFKTSTSLEEGIEKTISYYLEVK